VRKRRLRQTTLSTRRPHAGNSGGDALKETGAINKSLFTLGQVLQGLSARSRGAPGRVPYRDSTLTKLLWDSLQGSARTTMLACINPLASQADQTAHTLQFATAALRIRTKPIVRLDPHDKVRIVSAAVFSVYTRHLRPQLSTAHVQVVMDLRQTISSLQHENSALTRAFIFLSTGGDWERAIAGLPSYLSAQLPPPPSVPSSLHSSQSTPSSEPPQNVASMGPPAERAGSGIEAAAQISWMPPPSTESVASGFRETRSEGARELRPSTGRSSDALARLPSTGSRSRDSTGLLQQSPELAQMEAEFQQLLGASAR